MQQRGGEGFEHERYVPGRGPEPLPAREARGMERPLLFRDLTHWSSILAGFFVALSLFVLVGILGVGLGLGFITTPATPAGLTTAAAIWGVVTVVVSYFCAGWFAARCASVSGTTMGLIQGVTVWAVTTAALLVLGAFGLAGTLGFMGANVPGMMAAQPTMSQAAALASFIALILGLAAAAFGGWLGGFYSRDYTAPRQR